MSKRHQWHENGVRQQQRLCQAARPFKDVAGLLIEAKCVGMSQEVALVSRNFAEHHTAGMVVPR
eukprot:CAMPEP_0178465294 /NCGR_PEP_ID=MMETSP0689_2-20121128/51284_1 /TAXON_ID=160604 /ORGANISM="Amphidinium massartii, Strain CS-259" /LENGTH=63 /DNA_ID=CAMNT_0020092223 /DNA_START=102 /DNA_END=289 /DNA_ORIENTATION=-